MHILINSACQKKAWPRTRRILDSYARRVGERSWATHITMEGLAELHGLLKSSATRQTAVVCYVNNGNRQMRLVWTVGSKSTFGVDGFMPVAFTRKKGAIMPNWVGMVSLLAQSGGYLHDWGKSCMDFQKMLGSSVVTNGADIVRDKVRHEWLSYRLINMAYLHGFDKAWSFLSSEASIKEAESLQAGVIGKESALDYIVVTHHRLLGGDQDARVDASGHIKSDIPVDGLKSIFSINKSLYEKSMRLMGRINDDISDEGWRPIATIARSALILADHYISSIDYKKKHGTPVSVDLYANTKITKDGLSRFDQPLNWHLESVGDKSAEIVRSLASQYYEPLSEMTIEGILERSLVPRFSWQDKAVDFIKRQIGNSSSQVLIFNTAGTGAGKTRGNAKIACSISDAPRFCIALNLRSLTLQSGDSLKYDLGILPDEMAVVIGDKTSEKLHNNARDAFSADGLDNSEIDVVGSRQALPEWLKPLSTKGRSAELIMPPVLVSTIDFLINASEPGKQGNHALALLRLLNSDLILDELDSYDVDAMVAVLRLIQTSAMLGRNVICSSATISKPVARAVKEAFESGCAMHCSMLKQQKKPLIMMVDDLIEPSVYADESFDEWVSSRHKKLLEKLAEKPVYRRPEILTPEKRDTESYVQSIISKIDEMHDKHKWQLDSDKEISFGLVRIANIGNAMKVAKAVSDYYLKAGREIRIACYHSNELRIQRFMKERALDGLLKRTGDWKKRIANDEIVKIPFAKEAGSIPFIVIATPVEEIGRDHDFDWAIIEPSSAQSIVQTCGRVNRHRLEEVMAPNIAILDYNFNAINAPNNVGFKKSPVFHRPGVETNKHIYSSRLISSMIPKDLDRIDAGFRLGTTEMGRDEDSIIEKRLSPGLDIILGRNGNESIWMTRYFYSRYPLRAKSFKLNFRMIRNSPHDFELQVLRNTEKDYSWDRTSFTIEKSVCNSWLSWSDEELYQACLEYGIRPEDGMTTEIVVYQDGDNFRLIRNESFGFRRE